MKKILCFTLAFLLCLSSVCTAYASSIDSDHGGTGGSLGGNHGGTGGSIDWETLEPVDHSDFDKVIGTLGFLMHPDSAVANAGLTLANLLGLDDLDDDTKTYINDNIMDNTRTDGDNYYFNQNFVQNINLKVQSRVHALNGYYLVDSLGEFSKDSVVYWLNKLYGFDLLSYLNASETNLNNFNKNFNKFNFAFVANIPNNIGWTFITSNLGKSVGSSVFWFVDSDNSIKLFDSDSSKVLNNYSIYSTYHFGDMISWNNIQSARSHIFGCLGASQKIFYSLIDINNYINQGQKFYSPNLPNKTIWSYVKI